MEQPHFANPKCWLLTAAIAGLGYYWRGAKGAAMLGVPTLVGLGLVTAQAGNAMFQFLPGPMPSAPLPSPKSAAGIY